MFIRELLRRAAKRFDANRAVFDPTLFDDPFASQVDWRPMSSVMTNFKSGKIRQVSPWRLELRPTFGNILLGACFAGAGLISLGMAVGSVLSASHQSKSLLIEILGGLLFGAVGVWHLRTMNSRHVFDKRRDLWWAGSMPPADDRSLLHRGRAARLSELHAVQLLTKRDSDSDGGALVSHEINLVFQDGIRRHILIQGGNSARREAEQLAGFLGVALWDMRDAYRKFDPARDRTFVQILKDEAAQHRAKRNVPASGHEPPAPRPPTNPRPAQANIVFPAEVEEDPLPPFEPVGIGLPKDVRKAIAPRTSDPVRPGSESEGKPLETAPDRPWGVLPIALLLVAVGMAAYLARPLMGRWSRSETGFAGVYRGVDGWDRLGFHFGSDGEVRIETVRIRCAEGAPLCRRLEYAAPRWDTAEYEVRDSLLTVFGVEDTVEYHLRDGYMASDARTRFFRQEDDSLQGAEVPLVVWQFPSDIPPLPEGSKVVALSDPDSLFSPDSFPCLRRGAKSFYPFSFCDNRYSYDMVGYENRSISSQTEIPGGRYIGNIFIDTADKAVILEGQGRGLVYVPWSLLR